MAARLSSAKEDGFTLVEMAIVIVIVGLIAGGIMVGRDLIKAAEIRATITQYEKYKAAVNTFRGKYNGLPGDLQRTDAIGFGLCPQGDINNCPAADGKGLGDNNGIITDTAGISNSNGEILAFWQQLSQANLIDASVSNALTSTYTPAPGALPELYVPRTKASPAVYWVAGSDSGKNYYGIVPLQAGFVANYKGLTPAQAQSMDSKIDDGMPFTGSVQARISITIYSELFAAIVGSNSPNLAPPAPPWPCSRSPYVVIPLSTASVYSVDTYPDNPACWMRLEF